MTKLDQKRLQSDVASTDQTKNALDKRAAELEESHRFLDSIIENIPTPIFVKEAEDLRIVLSNKATQKLVGLSSEELIGKTGAELSPQERAAYFAANDREILATGQPIEIPEQLFQTAEGKTRILHTRKVPIKDREGNPRYILGISTDITDQKRLEQQNQASWERRGHQVRTITEVAQEIAAAPALEELFHRVVHLIQKRFVYYYVQVYTLIEAELILQAGSGSIGQKLQEAGHKIPLNANLSLVAQAARTLEPILSLDVRQDARWLPNSLLPETKSELAVPIILRDEVLGVLDVQHHTIKGLTTEDQLLLTGLCGQIAIFIEYRRVEEQRQQAERQLKTYTEELEMNNRELQEFAFVASHDLQEPLRKIQAFSDRLHSIYGDVLDERGQDYLNRLSNAAIRMQELIADYLAFSRIAAMNFTSQKMDLTAVVRTVLFDFEEEMQETRAEITIKHLPVVEAELSQMHLLFRHLIGNALKYKQENVPPRIRVEGQLVVQPPGCCQISVADNGIGFDEQYLDRIFRAFQRLHNRDKYDGTGMGLAICRKVVERHNGHITAVSTPGQGSTFIVTLPVAQN